MYATLFSAIADNIVAEVNNTKNPPFATMNEVPKQVQIQIYRRIVGVIATMKTLEGEGVTLSGEAFNQTVGTEFCEHQESFATLLEFILLDEELEGHYAELIGTFTKDVFIPDFCEFEEITLHDEIEIIAQVFLLLATFTKQTIITFLEEASFNRFEEEDVLATDILFVKIMEDYRRNFPDERRNENFILNSMNYKQILINNIVNYGQDHEEASILIQRLALYVALHNEDVDYINNISSSECEISEHIGLVFTDDYEEILTYCDDIIQSTDDYDLSARLILMYVNRRLNQKHSMPMIESIYDYAKHAYEVFQMLRIIAIIRNRSDILIGLQQTFTNEEHERFSSYINTLNVLLPIHVEKD